VSELSVNPGSEFIVPPIKASLDEAPSADADFFVSSPEGLSYDRITRSSVAHLATSISGIAYYPRLKGHCLQDPSSLVSIDNHNVSKSSQQLPVRFDT
jgi:hypothetical protein